MAEEESKRLAMEEALLQQELEQEEELAQKQQQDQHNFAPLPASASVAASSAQSQQGNSAQRTEAMVPLKEYEELKIKLRILETKRTEDRERIRDAEKAKEESEQFLNIRTKLQGIFFFSAEEMMWLGHFQLVSPGYLTSYHFISTIYSQVDRDATGTAGRKTKPQGISD